jgi:hypothetical protein
MHGYYILRNDLTAVYWDGTDAHFVAAPHGRLATPFSSRSAAKRILDRVARDWPRDVFGIVLFP